MVQTSYKKNPEDNISEISECSVHSLGDIIYSYREYY